MTNFYNRINSDSYTTRKLDLFAKKDLETKAQLMQQAVKVLDLLKQARVFDYKEQIKVYNENASVELKKIVGYDGLNWFTRDRTKMRNVTLRLLDIAYDNDPEKYSFDKYATSFKMGKDSWGHCALEASASDGAQRKFFSYLPDETINVGIDANGCNARGWSNLMKEGSKKVAPFILRNKKFDFANYVNANDDKYLQWLNDIKINIDNITDEELNEIVKSIKNLKKEFSDSAENATKAEKKAQLVRFIEAEEASFANRGIYITRSSVNNQPISVKNPLNQVVTPIAGATTGGDSGVYQYFGICDDLLNDSLDRDSFENLEMYSGEKKYYKFLSRYHNCVGAVRYILERSMLGCFTDFKSSETLGRTVSSKLVHTVLKANHKIYELNAMCSEFEKLILANNQQDISTQSNDNEGEFDANKFLLKTQFNSSSIKAMMAKYTGGRSSHHLRKDSYDSVKSAYHPRNGSCHPRESGEPLASPQEKIIILSEIVSLCYEKISKSTTTPITKIDCRFLHWLLEAITENYGIDVESCGVNKIIAQQNKIEFDRIIADNTDNKKDLVEVVSKLSPEQKLRREQKREFNNFINKFGIPDPQEFKEKLAKKMAEYKEKDLELILDECFESITGVHVKLKLRLDEDNFVKSQEIIFLRNCNEYLQVIRELFPNCTIKGLL